MRQRLLEMERKNLIGKLITLIPEIGELTEEKILFEFDKIPIILRLQENRHESWDI